MEIKAIETRYRGYRFRSRLEARWAVYFDELGLKWEYEMEGFDLGEAGYYLPDFWLPQVRMWAEVKANDFNDAENTKARALAEATGRPVLRLVGPPDFKTYLAWEPPMEDWMEEYDYLISMYHNYPTDEHRFYSNSGYIPCWNFEGEWPDSGVRRAIEKSRSARFEHGEAV
ncbi:MAG: hypothetical protein PHH49_08570 [Candidatus Omnitrophica bacterium]|jgi:hypothetical protein|nr:hypothetical protein [Methanoregulaceae archaeon]MDD5488992.1 hypothetical protein [Candidatus Omnitrophota bacterium]